MSILDFAYNILNEAFIGRSLLLFSISSGFVVGFSLLKLKLVNEDSPFTDITVLTKKMDLLILIFMVIVFMFVPLIGDFVGLSQFQENYIEKAYCFVSKKGTTFFNRRGVFCSDGSIFVYSDYWHTYDTKQSKKYVEGSSYNLKYLPMTRLIVSASAVL